MVIYREGRLRLGGMSPKNTVWPIIVSVALGNQNAYEFSSFDPIDCNEELRASDHWLI